MIEIAKCNTMRIYGSDFNNISFHLSVLQQHFFFNNPPNIYISSRCDIYQCIVLSKIYEVCLYASYPFFCRILYWFIVVFIRGVWNVYGIFMHSDVLIAYMLPMFKPSSIVLCYHSISNILLILL